MKRSIACTLIAAVAMIIGCAKSTVDTVEIASTSEPSTNVITGAGLQLVKLELPGMT